MVRGRDVGVEGLFEAIRNIRFFDDDSAVSINAETQNASKEPVSSERVLASNLRNWIGIRSHGICIKPALQ